MLYISYNVVLYFTSLLNYEQRSQLSASTSILLWITKYSSHGWVIGAFYYPKPAPVGERSLQPQSRKGDLREFSSWKLVWLPVLVWGVEKNRSRKSTRIISPVNADYKYILTTSTAFTDTDLLRQNHAFSLLALLIWTVLFLLLIYLFSRVVPFWEHIS